MTPRKDERRLRHHVLREGEPVPADANFRTQVYAEWDPTSGLLHVFTLEWARTVPPGNETPPVEVKADPLIVEPITGTPMTRRERPVTLEQWLADLDVQDAGELAETFRAERWRVVKLETAKGFEPTGGPGTPHYITEELT